MRCDYFTSFSYVLLRLIGKHDRIRTAPLGTGWDYGKRNQWETDIFLGVLPKYQSDCTKLTFTLKQNYIPWSLQIKESRFSAEPLTCGMYFNTVFGDEFWVNEPDRYPKGYYGSLVQSTHPCFSGTTYHVRHRSPPGAVRILSCFPISLCLVTCNRVSLRIAKVKTTFCLARTAPSGWRQLPERVP